MLHHSPYVLKWLPYVYSLHKLLPFKHVELDQKPLEFLLLASVEFNEYCVEQHGSPSVSD